MAPALPPFRRGVRWHFGYSTSVPWEEKGKQKQQQQQKPREIAAKGMVFFYPKARASSFY